MGTSVKTVSRLVAGVSFVVLFAGILTLLVVLLLEPRLLSQTKDLVAFVGSLVPGTVIIGIVLRGLKRRLVSGMTVSRALATWLASEPLLLALVWTFIAVELVSLSYFAPVYALRVLVQGDPTAPLGSGLRVYTLPDTALMTRTTGSASAAWYQSGWSFRWGESTRIEIRGAQGYSDAGAGVRWPGFALFKIFSALEQPAVQLARSQAKLTVLPFPEHAEVRVRAAGVHSVFRGAFVLPVPANASVDLVARAPGFRESPRNLLVRGDITVELRLQQLPGHLRLRALDLDDREQSNLEVFVADTNRGNVLGQAIELAPGSYVVWVERRFPNRIVFAGPFQLPIRAEQTLQCQIRTTVRRPDEPRPPGQAGSIDCSHAIP